MYAFIFYSLIVTTSAGDAWVLDYDMTESDCEQALAHFEQAKELFYKGVTFTCEMQP